MNGKRELLLHYQQMRMAVIEKLLDQGVEFICTDGVMISEEAQIGQDTVIYPNTIIKGKTIIGSGCVIGPNTMIEDSTIGDQTTINSSQVYQSTVGNQASIGPFAHIRPNSTVQSHVHLGNFTEVKNSTIDEYTSVSHLTYVGDSDVGRGVNFGCGCVTVNYDGKNKHRTTVEDYAFIGCNTNLVAPVTVGARAFTAAGSTITEDVPPDALAIGRVKAVVKRDWAKGKIKFKGKE